MLVEVFPFGRFFWIQTKRWIDYCLGYKTGFMKLYIVYIVQTILWILRYLNHDHINLSCAD